MVLILKLCLNLFSKDLFIQCSGPKRYDLIDGRWTYSHDLVPMHEFLSKELSQTLNVHIDLTLLQYAVIPKKLIE